MLSGQSLDYICENREAFVADLVKKLGCTVVLKGNKTLIGGLGKQNDVVIYKNTSGNPGMATGGSGDVLSGIIASFISQGVDAFRSAVAGVYIHGLAGDDVTKRYSMMGNTPSLILKELPTTLGKIEKV